jgi:FkbM family methyltransferase
MRLPRSVRSSLSGLLRSLKVRGRWRLAPRLNRLFPVEPVELLLPDVGFVRLDLQDEDQLQIYWTGLHRDDARIIRLMREVLPADGIFLDVGANIGLHTLAAAGRVAAGGGAVVAFEPHPANFRTLKHNIARNSHSHVLAHNAGLAEAAETLTCQGPAQGGNWSLASQGPHSFQVRLLRLDDYLLEHPLPRLDLIKIDVEGAEVRVLRGARQAIERFRPVIVFEACPAWLRRLNTSNDELLGVLESMGYAIHRLPEDGRAERAPRIGAADLSGMGAGDWTNLVALPGKDPSPQPPPLRGEGEEARSASEGHSSPPSGLRGGRSAEQAVASESASAHTPAERTLPVGGVVFGEVSATRRAMR